MPSTGKIVAIVVLALAGVAVGLPHARDYVGNSFNLWQMERALATMHHAPRSLCITQESRVGLLMGGEGRCDYFVGQLRTYSGDRATVRDHYRQATLLNPITGRREPANLIFINGDRVRPSLVPPGLDTLAAWGLDAQRACRPMVIVYVAHATPANADPRCR